jgi:hypothetical protein
MEPLARLSDLPAIAAGAVALRHASHFPIRTDFFKYLYRPVGRHASSSMAHQNYRFAQNRPLRFCGRKEKVVLRISLCGIRLG